jgi:putative DNA primase/helicase
MPLLLHNIFELLCGGIVIAAVVTGAAPSAILDAAREYVKRGFSPVPVGYPGKKPIGQKWQELRLKTEAELKKHFNNAKLNIGLLLGLLLADVDLDCPETLRVWPVFALPTNFVFGRSSKPRSHSFYYIDPPIPSLAFRDPMLAKDQSMLIELRCLDRDGSIGHQTICPPSEHVSGESIRFDVNGEPANVDADVLKLAVARTAAAALLARYWPPAGGGRHECMLALAGWLARAQWTLDDAQTFCRAVYQALANPDPQALNRSDGEVEDTFQKHHSGAPITGFRTLAKKFDSKILTKISEWLAIPKLSPTAGGNHSFRLESDGVWFDSSDPDTKPRRISGHLEVLACTRDHASDNWGRLLGWHDPDGHWHTWPMPMSLLAGDGVAYRETLQAGGLDIAPGREARALLSSYIQSSTPAPRIRCVDRVGWAGNTCVLPGMAIGPAGKEEILYQTENHLFEHFYRTSGTLSDWQANVSQKCLRNSRLLFGVSSAFAPPLLTLLDIEGGGMNFWGSTSSGKTTLLVVAGSAIGGGGPRGFVRTWRTTSSALEAIATLHNDNLLLLDELRELPDSREADSVAYMLANGSGKGRMTRHITLRPTPQWKLLFLSTGEIRLSDQTAWAGRKTKGGAEIRLLNIPANAGKGMGVFEQLHGAPTAAAFANQLMAAAKRDYGCAFRAFLTELVASRDQHLRYAEDMMQKFVEEFLPENAAAEVGRALRRFALVCAAGELATAMSVTGWNTGDAYWGAGECFEAWLKDRGGAGAFDTEAALAQVRFFIEMHGASRFQSLIPKLDAEDNPVPEKVINRAGFWRNKAGAREYLISREVFQQEVSRGYSYKDVAAALEERGWLRRTKTSKKENRWTTKVRTPDEGQVDFFCVRGAILKG